MFLYLTKLDVNITHPLPSYPNISKSVPLSSATLESNRFPRLKPLFFYPLNTHTRGIKDFRLVFAVYYFLYLQVFPTGNIGFPDAINSEKNHPQIRNRTNAFKNNKTKYYF